jgi:anti-sigma factor RsiW
VTERRRFEVVAPDWGEAHLTLEAVVAYVDGELAAGPHERATRHLDRCPDCASEVVEQRQARTALRGADCPSLPSSLMTSLCAIPPSAELPPPPAGLSMDAHGELVAQQRPARPSRRSRRMRLGAGAAVSGLALGALAFGVPASGSLSGPAAGPTASFGPGTVPVARFAATPAPTPPPAATSAPRTTMLNASLPTDGR